MSLPLHFLLTFTARYHELTGDPRFAPDAPFDGRALADILADLIEERSQK